MLDFEELFKESQKEIISLHEQLNDFHLQLTSLVKQNADFQKANLELTAQLTILNATIIELTRRLRHEADKSTTGI